MKYALHLFPGIDLDYEPDHIDCRSTTTGVQCNTDNELKAVTTALRAAFPVGQYIMSAATWHVGAYGKQQYLLGDGFAHTA